VFFFKSLYPSTSLSVSESVCVSVCLSPKSFGTAGPIWLTFFVFAPSWLRGGFKPKKNSGSGIFFFPEKPGFQGII